jgi:hypothetical protein
MKYFKVFSRYLPVIAIVFVAWYFAGFERFPRIKEFNGLLALASFVVLLVVFLFRALLWHRLLGKFGVGITFKAALLSHFRTILFKYIPGKIWVVVGKANLISDYGYPLGYCTFLSVLSQMLMILSGFAVGILGIWLFDIFTPPWYLLFPGMILIAGGIFLFSKGFRFPAIRGRYVPRRLEALNGRRIQSVGDILVLDAFQWSLLGLAYWMFFQALGLSMDTYVLLLQPLANNIGIISAFVPGGLGIREGAMVGYLMAAGVSAAAAAGAAIYARLWFLAAEVCAFVIGSVLRGRRPRSRNGSHSRLSENRLARNQDLLRSSAGRQMAVSHVSANGHRENSRDMVPPALIRTHAGRR